MKLRVMHPSIGEFAFPLPPERSVVIGRGDGVDLELRWDGRISRRHARLWMQGRQIWFEDLGSKNGSWHGSTRINGAVRLEPGMSVLVGETVLFSPDPVAKEETKGALSEPPGAIAARRESDIGTQDLRMRPPAARGTSPRTASVANITIRDPAPLEPKAFATAKRFLDFVERLDLYGALEAPANALNELIEASLRRVERDLSEEGGLTPGQLARVKTARAMLERVNAVLRDPWRRLEHDFRTGHVRAEERLQQSKGGGGLSVSTLRRAWQGVYPDRVDRAAFHTRAAFASRQRGDLQEAIDNARLALEDNPFFDELRSTLKVWEDLAKRV